MTSRRGVTADIHHRQVRDGFSRAPGNLPAVRPSAQTDIGYKSTKTGRVGLEFAQRLSALHRLRPRLDRLLRTREIHQRRVRVKAAGPLSLLPLFTGAVIRKAEEATADYDAMTLTIAVAYGGR